MVSTVIWGSLRVIEGSFGMHVPRLSGESGYKDMHLCKMGIGSCMQHEICNSAIYFGIYTSWVHS